MDSFWSCDHRGTSWFRMTKLPFSPDSRVWVDMAVLHPGLVSSPHLLSQTQDVIEAPREEWGAPCPWLYNSPTLLTFLFHLPLPKRGYRQNWESQTFIDIISSDFDSI